MAGVFYHVPAVLLQLIGCDSSRRSGSTIGIHNASIEKKQALINCPLL